MPTINERTVPLDEMDDFQVAEGDPDVRGSEVYSSDGARIGRPLTREFEGALLRHIHPRDHFSSAANPYGERYDQERFYGSRRGRTSL